ncbi:unnamed protein product [Calypogeia fissa]
MQQPAVVDLFEDVDGGGELAVEGAGPKLRSEDVHRVAFCLPLSGNPTILLFLLLFCYLSLGAGMLTCGKDCVLLLSLERVFDQMGLRNMA